MKRQTIDIAHAKWQSSVDKQQSANSYDKAIFFGCDLYTTLLCIQRTFRDLYV